MPAYTATVTPPLPPPVQVAPTVLLKSVAVARDHHVCCFVVVEAFNAVSVLVIVTPFTVGATRVETFVVATWTMIRSPVCTVAGRAAVVSGLAPLAAALTKPRLAIGSIVYGSGNVRSSSESVSTEPLRSRASDQWAPFGVTSLPDPSKIFTG